MDLCRTQAGKKDRLEDDEPGEYWRCTAIEPQTRLRVGRGIGQTETQAAIALWTQVNQRDVHRHSPPPVLSDGWGGHREALVEVYGQVPPYTGSGRRPTRKQPAADWHYTPMVKQRDATGNRIGIDLPVIYGDDTTPQRTGTPTTCVERTNLTSRHMKGRLVRKTLGYSKRVQMLKAACAWEDMVYNLARPVKTLPCAINPEGKPWLPCSPMLAAGLTDHIWSIRELLMLVPLPTNSV